MQKKMLQLEKNYIIVYTWLQIFSYDKVRYKHQEHRVDHKNFRE